MNKKIIGLAASVGILVVAVGFFAANARAQAPAAPADGQFNCFDQYKFGSVDMKLSNPTLATSAGSEFPVSVTVTNTNDYPIVGGSVYVRIYRKQDSAANTLKNGNNLVDEYAAIDHLDLAAHQTATKTFTWKVPNAAIAGGYEILPYYLSEGKFTMTGLPFTDDVHGAPLDFKVAGQSSGAYFDKNSVTVNGDVFHFIGTQDLLDPSKPVTVTATIVNTTSSAKNVPVVARVYRWSQTEPDGHLSDMTQQVTVQPGQKKTVSFTVTDQQSVTDVSIQALDSDAKSILDVRFGRDGLGYPRINFAGISSYPLKSGTQTSIFACFHAAGSSKDAFRASIPGKGQENAVPGYQISNGKIVLTLADSAGATIATKTYTGPITGDMMAFRDAFVPQASSGDLTLRADAYQGAVKLDSVTIRYSCSSLGSDACSAQQNNASNGWPSSPFGAGSDTIVWSIIGLLIILIILSVAARSMKRKKMNVLVIGLIGLTALGFSAGGAGVAHADTVSWTGYGSGNAAQGVPHCYGTPSCAGVEWDGTSISNAQVTVTYGASITNADTGAIIPNGSTIAPGTRIMFQPQAYGPLDIFWSGTGGMAATPYGYWGGPVYNCLGQDQLVTYTTHDQSGFGYPVYGYFPVSVVQPGNSISAVTGPVSGSGWGPYTVTGNGTISATVTFAPTSGVMIGMVSGGIHGSGCTIGVSNAYHQWQIVPTGPAPSKDVWDFNVSSEQIPFTLNVVTPNAAPATPTINGPTPVTAGTSNSYTAVSTDPDGDNLHYNIDFDSNHSSIDLVTGVTGSGVASAPFTKSYASAGTYTIYAQAVDTSGATSGWGSYSVTVNAIPTYTLNVALLGGGAGTITSAPGTISCPGSCSQTGIASGTYVLHAAPDAASTFSSWGGACAGTPASSDCSLNMNADRFAAATFDVTVIPQKTLGVTVSGNGSISSSPAGISCPSGSCSADYNLGSTVTLTAAPNGSDTFKGWGGSCAGLGLTCSVTMSAAKAVTADFSYTLGVTAAGPSGSGSVSGGGVSCAAGNVGTCSAPQTAGGSVTLTEAPNSGYYFTGWSGSGCSGTGTTCTVAMTTAQTVTATFGGGGTACSDGIDNDGDGLIDYPSDGGCGSPGGTGEPGGGPLTSAVCSPSGVTTLNGPGNVTFSASATALGGGSGTFDYSWDGGTTWSTLSSKSLSYSIPGGSGPILKARDHVGPGPALTASPTCGNVVVTGSVTVTVGTTPTTATGDTIAIPQGKSFVVKWDRNLTPTYDCSGTINPSPSGGPSWSSFTGSDFSANGTSGTLSTSASTPVGPYTFGVTCTDSSATPGPTYSDTGTVRVTSSSENEI